jgi:hypothetical protein
MAEEPDINKILSVPRLIFPIAIPPAADSVRANQFQLPEESNPGSGVGAETPCTNLHPYVMRSKQFGSLDPSSDAAPLGMDVIGEDTYDRDNPPRIASVAITVGGTIGDNPNVTTAPHGIAVGESISVVFAATNSSPTIDGNTIATYVSATVVSVSVDAALTVAATSGTMAILCDGVTYDPVPRIYKAAGVTKKFARQVKYDSCGELYYIGPEVEIEKCSSSNPYKMRDRRYGSANPTSTIIPLSLDQANTDTWDRFTPPIYNGIAMDGVDIGELPRHYISGSGSGTYSEKIFDRLKKYDSCGELYYVGVEVLVETATNSGSGSAGGGI